MDGRVKVLFWTEEWKASFFMHFPSHMHWCWDGGSPGGTAYFSQNKPWWYIYIGNTTDFEKKDKWRKEEKQIIYPYAVHSECVWQVSSTQDGDAVVCILIERWVRIH